MWRPPERIHFEPAQGRVPTRDEAEHSLLFQPIDIGPVHLNSRTWVPAMVPWRASEDGFVTPEILAWYERFAQGRPGAIVVEATGIRDIPSGPLLRIGHDRFLPGLTELVETVRTASGGQTRLFIQIIDFLTIRRRPKPDKYFQSYLRISDHHREATGLASESDVRVHLAALSEEDLGDVLTPRELEDYHIGYRERVTDMQLPHIRSLPQVLPDLFASAAYRAETAGFDGVELHYAHAYTMASFLSRLNDRQDGYGGGLENRARLPVEVFQAVKTKVGESFAVGCRFLTEDCVEGGNDVEDAIHFGVMFAKAGMDYLSTSRGGRFEDAAQPKVGWAAYPYTGRSGYECMPQNISDEHGPFGRNIEPTARIRAAIRDEGLSTPVVVTGGIHNYEQAERILRDDKADIIGAARQSLADPDWYLKTRFGSGAEIRLCKYTNYCEGLDQKHKQVTCKLWDRLNVEEAGDMVSHDGKRRLVPPPWPQEKDV